MTDPDKLYPARLHWQSRDVCPVETGRWNTGYPPLERRSLSRVRGESFRIHQRLSSGDILSTRACARTTNSCVSTPLQRGIRCLHRRELATVEQSAAEKGQRDNWPIICACLVIRRQISSSTARSRKRGWWTYAVGRTGHNRGCCAFLRRCQWSTWGQ